MKKLTFILTLLVVVGLNAQSTGYATLNPNENNTQTIALDDVDLATEPINDELVIDKKEVSFNETTHDFGNVKEGTKPTFTFVMTNNGTEPIVISQAKPGCGCTAAEFTKAPIMPGTTGEIPVTFTTAGRPGVFSKTIKITTNKGIFEVYIKGNVEKTASDSQPKGIKFGK